MKSTFCALIAALTLSVSSGCCLWDCFCHHGGCGGCDNCSDQGCSYCGPHCGACGCPEGGCGAGGCSSCASGNCGGPGPYGPDGYGQAGPPPQGYVHGGGYAPGGYADGGCRDCAPHHACSPIPDCYDDHRAIASQLGGPAGPPTPQVTYPYYTTRGPRDFFANHPPSIGP